MFFLQAAHALIAIALLLLGLVTTFSIGMTGLIFLGGGALFAAIAGAASTRSRASVGLALGMDSLLAGFAAVKLQHLLGFSATGAAVGPHIAVARPPTAVDFAIPAAVIALVVCGFVAVMLDWRNIRNAKWF